MGSVLSLGLATAAVAHAQTSATEVAEWNIPQWAAPTVHEALARRSLGLFLEVNPFYVQGDFDGDGQLDLAIQVQHGVTHRRGILVVHYRARAVYLLGAGQVLGNGGDDFSWLWQWSVYDRSVLQEPRARGRHVLYLGKGDSAGGMVWWSGTAYVWTQWGD